MSDDNVNAGRSAPDPRARGVINNNKNDFEKKNHPEGCRSNRRSFVRRTIAGKRFSIGSFRMINRCNSVDETIYDRAADDSKPNAGHNNGFNPDYEPQCRK